MQRPSKTEVHADLERIKKLHEEFNLEVDALQTDGGSTERAQQLKAELETKVVAIKEIVGSKEVSFAEARDIMEKNGQNFIGLEEVGNTFYNNLKPEQVPDIPFSEQDLIRAESLGQCLVLETNFINIHSAASMMSINNLLSTPFAVKNKGEILQDPTGWYKFERFYRVETIPKLRWVLKSKEIIPGSEGVNRIGLNYLEQTKVLAKYIKEQIFAGQKLPPEYEEAIEEFKQYYTEHFHLKAIDVIMMMLRGPNKDRYAEELTNLKINQRYRETPVSAMQTAVVLLDNTDYRRLETTAIWTNRLDRKNDPVTIGYYYSGGMEIDRMSIDKYAGSTGLTFCRDH